LDHARFKALPEASFSWYVLAEVVRSDDPEMIVTRSRVTAVWIGPNHKPMRVPPDLKALLAGTPIKTDAASSVEG